MSTHRSAIIASTIRQVVARYALQVPPDVASVVSITDVTLNSDATIATVAVGALQNPKEAVIYLADHEGEIKSALSSQIKTYTIPRLKFIVDEKTDKINRLEELLGK